MVAHIGRVSTLGLHTRTLNDFGTVQSHMANLQNQISSGIKTDRFDGMNGDIEQFVNLEADVKRLQNYENNNSETISRLRITRESVASLVDIADDIENLMVLRRSAGAENSLGFDQQLKSKTETLVQELSLKVSGRYMFSGTRSNVPPIKEPIPPPAEDGVPDDNYYQGSKNDIIIRPQDNHEIEYPVRADDEGFQKIFAAINLSLKGHNEGDDTKLVQALDIISSGVQDIIKAQTKLDAQIVEMELINQRHEASRLYLTGVVEGINKTDVLTASTQVALDETILTASFRVFGRISALSLQDFLN